MPRALHEMLKRRHTHKDRLELLRSCCNVSLPTFLVRRELTMLYHDAQLVEQMIALEG
jgi:hypothetical protein